MSISFDDFDIFELFLSEPENIVCEDGKSGVVFKKSNGEEKLELTIFPDYNVICVRIFWRESKIIDVSLTDISKIEKIEKRERYLIVYKGKDVIASILLSDRMNIAINNKDMW